MKKVLSWMLALAVSAALTSIAATPPFLILEDFRGDPATNGWRTFGHTNLFAWNAANANLQVTWDSSKSNSYFYKSLPRALSRMDDFHLYFDLRMSDIAIGTTSNKPYTFQIAIGLLNFRQATNGNFLRGTGYDSPNVFEFDYFPDSGFGATISPTVISSNNEFASGFILQEVTTNDVFRVHLRNDEDDDRVRINVLKNGTPYVEDTVFYPGTFTDFNVDTLAIASYSDEGQHPDFGGSVLAHGVVDNVVLSVGGAPLNMNFIGTFENGNWRMDFDTMPGWFYIAYRTEDFITRPTVGTVNATNYGRATIIHTNPPPGRQFYSIQASRL